MFPYLRDNFTKKIINTFIQADDYDVYFMSLLKFKFHYHFSL